MRGYMSGNPMQRWPVWYITASKWVIRYLFSIILKCTALWSGAGEGKHWVLYGFTIVRATYIHWKTPFPQSAHCLHSKTIYLRDQWKATKIREILSCAMRHHSLSHHPSAVYLLMTWPSLFFGSREIRKDIFRNTRMRKKKNASGVMLPYLTFHIRELYALGTTFHIHYWLILEL